MKYTIIDKCSAIFARIEFHVWIMTFLEQTFKKGKDVIKFYSFIFLSLNLYTPYILLRVQIRQNLSNLFPFTPLDDMHDLKILKDTVIYNILDKILLGQVFIIFLQFF
jgi:hypothetical protein